MQNSELLWLILIVVFGILEASTVQFVSIWFAGGALFAFVAAFFGATVVWQSVAFVLASGILLILTRPIVKKLTKNVGEATNADSLIGKKAVITREPDAVGAGGEAKIAGNFWSIKCAGDEKLKREDIVTVEKIEGVKLIVRK